MHRPLFALLGTILAAAPLHAAAPASATFTIKTMTAQMRYDTAELLVTPGQPVKIIFENGDDLPHNLVFCQPGTDTMQMALKQMENPEQALKRNWLPDDSRIWAHSRMLNPHDRQEFSFIAPAKTGTYPYVCTFPGHALTMHGELKVAPQGDTLHDLSFALYLGDWKQLPDFSKLSPHRTGKIADNLIQIKLDDYKNDFGVVFTGRLDAPKKGPYRFYLASDDGARILIDGKEVLADDGIHPASDIKEKSVTLERGAHDFRLEYFQSAGQIELYAAWKGTNFQVTPLSKWLHPNWQGGARKKDDFPPIPLVVTNEPVLYRNFIQGAGNRGIAVGYPGGVNIAWSADSMNLALVWRGAFIDASRHWNSRGGGYQPPLGYDVLKPTGEVTPAFFICDNPDAAWPAWEKDVRFDGFAWKGYTLDAGRNPTFRYTWHDATIEESFAASGDGSKADGQPALVRTITISGRLPEHAWFRILAGDKIEGGDGSFVCRDGNAPFQVRADGAIRAGRNVVIPPKPGTITVTYQWVR